MASRSKLTKRTFISKIDGKEYVRQLTYDECYEMIQNQGRLLSEEYKGKNANNNIQVWLADSDGPIVPFEYQKFYFSLQNLDISVWYERKCRKILHWSFAFHQVFQARRNVSWWIFPFQISISNTTSCCTKRTRMVQHGTMSTVSVLSKCEVIL